jgi:enterochelin esterase-like enzyme
MRARITPRSRRRLRFLIAVIALAWVLAGSIGGYSYWEAYYQHRGFIAPSLLPSAHRGRAVHVKFYSAALHREADYYAFLPPDYDPARRYPVFYLLHGSPGRPQVYFAIAHLGIRIENLISLHRIKPMILVFPDSRIADSTFSDSEWANTSSGHFESYVLDVVRDVGRRWHASPSRAERAIAGFSEGAYGAINLALHHLSVFGNLEVWSGYFTQKRTGVFSRASARQLAENSPIDYVHELRPTLRRFPLRAFLFVGRGDHASRQIVRMADALASAGGTVSYAIYHGGHDWQLWDAHLNQMLILASRDMSNPLRHRRIARAHRLAYVPPSRHGPRAHRPPPVTGRRGPGSLGGRIRLEPLAALTPPTRHHQRSPGTDTVVAGLVLALLSAALINIGFLLQHRGLAGLGPLGLQARLRGAVRNRTWLSGQAIGWTGFLAQIAAVAIAPLSLVQAFAAGGLALSVPIAAGVFGYRVSRRQAGAVLLVALGLAVLPIGLSHRHDHLHSQMLTGTILATALIAITLSAVRSAAARAVAAGIFYGIADAAIKAGSVGLRAGSRGTPLPVWAAVAVAGTLAGFLVFQAALSSGSAITAISLMNALAAIVALACGALAFRESLGRDPAHLLVHLLGIGLVLGCVPTLATAQTEMAEPSPGARRDRPPAAAPAPGYRSG